jgi:succinate dehydrogenase / fumarate reductase cytochrome b subunit
MARPHTPPKFLDLLRIQMPVGAVLSIAHRVSGVMLFLSLPLMVYLLGLSLQGPAGYERAQDWLGSLPVQMLLILLAWSVFHHLLAGIRHLLLDIHVGVDRPQARRSAWLVNLAALALLLWVLVERLT